jgi:hypothetical protein
VEPGEHLPHYRGFVLDHYARHRVSGEPHSGRRLTVLCPVERGELLPLSLHLAFHRVELTE